LAVRILLDRTLRHAPVSRLGRTAKDHPVWLIHGPEAPQPACDAWRATGATLIDLPDVADDLYLATALARLADRGLTSILVEGGSTLGAALVRRGLVDDLALFSGAALIGDDGHPALGPLYIGALANAPRLRLAETQQLGPDLFSLWQMPGGTTDP
jgi:diaminohydroxyphosphoribosylaminopyrimidine deaminase / 5-amino-6-(5-phosphoribosylamino)uracil reductase